jgi:hypothetical protein
MKRFNESTLSVMLQLAQKEKQSLHEHIEKLEETQDAMGISDFFASYILEYKSRINECLVIEIQVATVIAQLRQDRLALSN